MEWLNQVDLAFRSELRDAHEFGLQRLEAKVDQRFAELRAEQKDDIRSLQISLRDLRAEPIKWMFLFWVGTVGLTLATRFLK